MASQPPLWLPKNFPFPTLQRRKLILLMSVLQISLGSYHVWLFYQTIPPLLPTTHTHAYIHTHMNTHTYTHMQCLSFTRLNKYTQPLQQSFIWPGFNIFLISVTLLSKCDPFCLPLLWCVAQKQHYTANLYWVNPKDLFYLLSAMAYSPSIYRAGAQALVCPLNFILHLWASPSFHRIFFP